MSSPFCRGVWTDERVERLARLWRDGQSASQVAAALGVTRNAVIGKVFRLGLSGDGRHAKARPPRPRPVRKPRARPAKSSFGRRLASPSAGPPPGLFDALNWALGQWPQMSLALTGAAGGERLARRWAQQKRVRLVLARPDFQRHGRAAPFRANDALLSLEPVCVLVLARSLEAAEGTSAFGPALNLAELAQARGLRCVRIARRCPAGG